MRGIRARARAPQERTWRPQMCQSTLDQLEHNQGPKPHPPTRPPKHPHACMPHILQRAPQHAHGGCPHGDTQAPRGQPQHLASTQFWVGRANAQDPGASLTFTISTEVVTTWRRCSDRHKVPLPGECTAVARPHAAFTSSENSMKPSLYCSSSHLRVTVQWRAFGVPVPVAPLPCPGLPFAPAAHRRRGWKLCCHTPLCARKCRGNRAVDGSRLASMRTS